MNFYHQHCRIERENCTLVLNPMNDQLFTFVSKPTFRKKKSPKPEIKTSLIPHAPAIKLADAHSSSYPDCIRYAADAIVAASDDDRSPDFSRSTLDTFYEHNLPWRLVQIEVSALNTILRYYNYESAKFGHIILSTESFPSPRSRLSLKFAYRSGNYVIPDGYLDLTMLHAGDALETTLTSQSLSLSNLPDSALIGSEKLTFSTRHPHYALYSLSTS